MAIRFGLLGAGRIGKVHGAAVAAVEGARLAAVADPVADAADALVRKHGGEVRTIEAIEAVSGALFDLGVVSFVKEKMVG